MNIFFWLLVVLAVVGIWICGVYIFIPIGRAAKEVSKKVVHTINYEEKEENNGEHR